MATCKFWGMENVCKSCSVYKWLVKPTGCATLYPECERCVLLGRLNVEE